MRGFYSDAIVGVRPDSLRILLAPSAYYPNVGGIEELTRQLALALRAKGHDVAILTNRWPARSDRFEVCDGVEVARVGLPLPAARALALGRFVVRAPPAVAAVVSALRRRRANVVHVIGAGPPSAYLATLRPLLDARLVFTAQGELAFDAHDVFARSWSLRAGLRRMLRVADVVTACSEYVLRGLEDFAHVDAPVCVVPNGVEPSDFASATPPRRERPYVLAVGRLAPQKAFDVLLDAFARTRLRELDLVVAGDGPERERLHAQTAKLRLVDRVEFRGAVDRDLLAQLLAGARAFALPSRAEPFGIALLEAMAAGVPAVATAAGGVPEFAQDARNALLVAPDDPAMLRAALERLHTDETLRDRLIAGGRRTANEHRWPRIADRYLALYRS